MFSVWGTASGVAILANCAGANGGGGGATATVGGNDDGTDWKGVFCIPGASLLACSSALANACTVTKRCLGSFASAVFTTCSSSDEIVGTRSRKGAGGANMCCVQSSVKEPLKGRSPLSHSYTTIPSEY